jgi:hypothetical protein
MKTSLPGKRPVNRNGYRPQKSNRRGVVEA